MRLTVSALAATALIFASFGQVSADLYTGVIADVPPVVDNGGPDPLYNFTFTDYVGDTGFGSLVTAGDHVVSGNFTLVTTDGAAPVGTYPLLPAGPGYTLSPSQLWQVDNLLYPANDANTANNGYATATPPSYLDTLGLLFGLGGVEINLWGNGGTDGYSFGTSGGNNGNTQHYNGPPGTFALTAAAVPEPASFVAWTLLGFCIAGWSWQRKK